MNHDQNVKISNRKSTCGHPNCMINNSSTTYQQIQDVQNQASQSSSANASTPNADAASLVPPARLSIPLLMNLTSPSNSEEILSNRSAISSGDPVIFIDENVSVPIAGSLSNSGSLSSSSSEDDNSSSVEGCENPMILRRFRPRRLLLWRLMSE